MKVEHKARTRSSAAGRPKTEDEEHPKQTPKAESRSPTPKHSNSRSQSKKKVQIQAVRHKKTGERVFFTVAEDAKILELLDKDDGKHPVTYLADKLSRNSKHSVESIRDRIKRVLAKLKQVDVKLLKEEAKVIHRLFVLSSTAAHSRTTLHPSRTSRRSPRKARDPSSTFLPAPREWLAALCGSTRRKPSGKSTTRTSAQ